LVLVVAVAIKFGDNSPTFTLAIAVDGIENKPANLINIFKIIGCNVLENIGNGE